MKMNVKNQMQKKLGTWDVMVAGVALVVAASTLVSDFSGYFNLGISFIVAVVLAFSINLLLGLSASELSVAYPRAGALYDYARAIFKGRKGQLLGVFFGITFCSASIFAIAGETSAGAFVLQSLFSSDLPIGFFILVLSILALLPNLFGIRSTAWVSSALLLLMLGIRWGFGIAGFLGVGSTQAWSPQNLQSEIGMLDWFGEEGILSAGLVLAIWSFIGIEFACSLAEEVKNPKKSLPRGILLGLVLILLTSIVMGLGVTGTLPLVQWQEMVNSPMGCNGDCPQLAVGQLMFGELGFNLMAIASVAATLGSLTILYAALPRILFSIARDGYFFGSFSTIIRKVHPKTGTPIIATLLIFVISLIPALYNSEVVDWIYSAAYVWILLYIAFHILALVNRKLNPNSAKVFQGKWLVVISSMGIIGTALGLFYAFRGGHIFYGGRALIVIGVVLIIAFISFGLSEGKTKEKTDVKPAKVIVKS